LVTEETGKRLDFLGIDWIYVGMNPAASGVRKPVSFVGIWLMATCAVLLGISHALGRKILLESVEPLVAVAIRNAISAAVVLIIATVARWVTGAPRRYLTYDRWTWLAVAGRSLSGIFYFYGLSALTATAGILLYRLNPVYTLILALVLVPAVVRRQLSLGALVLGTVLSVAGAVMGAGAHRPMDAEGSGAGAGILFMLLAGPCFSLFLVSWEKHRASAIEQSDFSARQGYQAQIELWALIPLLLGAVSISLLKGWTVTSAGQWLELGVLGTITGCIGILYFEAVKRIGALLASVIVGLEVHVTILFERLWLGEPVTIWALVGGVLVLAGVALVARENQVLMRNL
jgi:drug/metabolite transporter (DMT)-like permease